MTREQWTPVRFVHEAQRCDFCWERIPKGSPGHKSGTRGTKAFYNAVRRVWECLACREEGFRAEAAREQLDDQKAREAECRNSTSAPAI